MLFPSKLNYLIGIWGSQIITVVSDQTTDAMNGKRPFEDRCSRALMLSTRGLMLSIRLSDLDSRLQVLEVQSTDTNSRLHNLELRAYDTKPIWEQAIKEIVETRRELSKRLDRIDAMALETPADLRDAEDRLDKIERKPTQ